MNAKIAITTKELQAMLSCGYQTAVKVGTMAEARIQIGTRVLWNVEKVREYMRYAEATKEKKVEAFANLEGKIKIS